MQLIDLGFKTTPNNWQGRVARFRQQTQQTYDPARSSQAPRGFFGKLRTEARAQYDKHAQVIIRPRELDGRPVENYDIFFNSKPGSGRKGVPISALIEDKHVNKITPNIITFFRECRTNRPRRQLRGRGFRDEFWQLRRRALLDPASCSQLSTMLAFIGCGNLNIVLFHFGQHRSGDRLSDSPSRGFSVMRLRRRRGTKNERLAGLRSTRVVMMGKVILCRESDAAAMVESIRALLAEEAVEVLHDDGSDPAPWEAVVFLVLVTPAALTSPALAERASGIAAADLPMVPVVSDFSTFDFRQLPPSHQVFCVRHAVGLEPGGGQQVLETVRGYLGLQAFTRDQKVFISYRRSDAEQPANAIEQYLWSQRYSVFLDTRQVPGGEVFQEQIMGDLHDKDFVLFLDSPDASDSPWVQAELIEALRRRIPVCAVCLDADTRHMRMFEDIPSVNWEPDNPRNFNRIGRMLARGIASKCSLDARMYRTLRESAKMTRLDVKLLGPRLFRLSRGNQNVIVEYENRPVSLERLHRLVKTTHTHDGCPGIFVCGDIQPLPPTLEAIAWASHKQPLKVMPIFNLYSELRSCFP